MRLLHYLRSFLQIPHSLFGTRKTIQNYSNQWCTSQSSQGEITKGEWQIFFCMVFQGRIVLCCSQKKSNFDQSVHWKSLWSITLPGTNQMTVYSVIMASTFSVIHKRDIIVVNRFCVFSAHLLEWIWYRDIELFDMLIGFKWRIIFLGYWIHLTFTCIESLYHFYRKV